MKFLHYGLLFIFGGCALWFGYGLVEYGSFMPEAAFAVGASCFALIASVNCCLKKKRDRSVAFSDEALQKNDFYNLSSDGYVVLNAQEHIVSLNSKARYFLNLNDEHVSSLVGLHWSKIFDVTDVRQIIKNKNVISSYIRSGKRWVGDINFSEGEDSQDIDASVSVRFEKLDDIVSVIVIEDITQYNQVCAERDKAHKQLLRSQKTESIARLVGGIVHDFNNILASVMGYAEFLEEDLRGQEKLRKYAENILEGTDQAKKLVDQVLVFTRSTDQSKDRLDISRIVNETFSMLRAGIPDTVEIYHDKDSKNAFVYGNVSQLSQIFINLSVNAFQALDAGNNKGVLKVATDRFTPDKAVIIGHEDTQIGLELRSVPAVCCMASGSRCLAQVGEFESGQEYISISIEDSGSGIPYAVIQKMFRPFYTTRNDENSSGMGLSVVVAALSKHNGVLVLDTELEEGSRFTVYFPVFEQEEQQEESREIKAEGGHAHGKILIVEDQESVRLMMEKMVTRIGYDVVSCANGLEALDFVREDPMGFNAIVTDQLMPKITGLELAKELEQDFHDLPIVLVSGYSPTKLEVAIRDYPLITTFLKKPVSKGDLAEAVEEAIRKMPRDPSSYDDVEDVA